jgi:gliding motility-associated lipoprotein GldD
MSSKNYLAKFFIFSLAYIFISCNDDYVPKPRGFQRLDLPKHTYKNVTSACGFSFDIPVYSELVPDTHPQAEKCWYNLYYIPFNATLHLSYKPVANRDALIQMTEDARTMVYKHTIKADEIYESSIGKNNFRGMMYELSGSTATNFQFYITDTSKHFILGSLYFNDRTNSDSIAPALEHLKKDILYMLNSLQWK